MHLPSTSGAFAALALCCTSLVQAAWQPTSVSRTVLLAGDSPRASSQVSLDSSTAEPEESSFRLAIPDATQGNLSTLRASLGKGDSQTKLSVTRVFHDLEKAATIYDVAIPPETTSPVQLSINEVYTHAASPLPKALTQAETDHQHMLWQGDLLGGLGLLYDIPEAKVRVKAPSPRVKDFQAPTGFEASQSPGAATIVFSSTESVSGPLPASVHYFQPEPVSSYRHLFRQIQASHWSGQLAVHEEIELVNNGPELKGHFARIDYQKRAITRRNMVNNSPSILSGLAYALPPRSHSAYVVDTVGQVSTFKFLPSDTTAAQLDLRPRFPLLGGWTYNYTMGYQAPLGDYVVKDPESGSYVLAVPILDALPDVPVDEAEIHVVLPEGAQVMQVTLPSRDVEVSRDVTWSYLDTTGHPTIVLKKTAATEINNELILIKYNYSLLAHAQKPLAVSAAAAAFALVFMIYSRIDWRIGPGSAAAAGAISKRSKAE